MLETATKAECARAEIAHYKRHFVAFLGVVALTLLVASVRPSTFKDAPTSVGTIGSFVTLFGVVFAIIELRYTRTAAELAAAEAARVRDAMSRTISIEHIVECQASIEAAIASLDAGTPAAPYVMAHIVKIYSRVFASEVEKDDSDHRKTRSLIQSYQLNPNSAIVSGTNQRSGTQATRTRKALMDALGQLSVYHTQQIKTI
ncbi:MULTISPECIES: hypothetical protein [Burkholderia]|uniref:hypothetical protein n=1 Tax=Burkholderia TaxID=32008 RepID=UPI000AF1C0C1|nr:MULTISPECIES: hypothetical protein [Burkholderia]